MKASEIIERLRTIVAEKGDMEVGIFNDELCHHDELTSIGIATANRSGEPTDDDVSLGNEFISINSD